MSRPLFLILIILLLTCGCTNSNKNEEIVFLQSNINMQTEQDKNEYSQKDDENDKKVLEEDIALCL